MSIGDWDEAHLLAWIRQTLNLPENLRGLLAKTAKLSALNFGVATITWGGASSLSSQATVPHGLSVTPTLVLALPRFTGSAPWGKHVSENAAPDATNVYLIAHNADGTSLAAGTSIGAYWLAAA